MLVAESGVPNNTFHQTLKKIVINIIDTKTITWAAIVKKLKIKHSHK